MAFFNSLFDNGIDPVSAKALQEDLSVGFTSIMNSHNSMILPGALTTYSYDDANRMTSVNGTSYTWDNNGNLTDDDVDTYTYDTANHLTSITDGTETSSYTYNGLGDRLSQTVNGVTTNYTLDLNAGLTQVLTDGVDTYLYGLSRLGQVDETTEYFLGDALGSVRQLTNTSGAITLTKNYAPFGEVLSSSGTGDSVYGFTGEVTDTSGLVYLRTRYYLPGSGRFISRDTWAGDYFRSLSLNHWNYVEGNPISRTDPFGMCFTSWLPWKNDWSRRNEEPIWGLCSRRPPEVNIIHATQTCTPTSTVTSSVTPTPGKMAYLTFDDQPNGNTPYVLSILNAHGNIKATFFILGQNLDLFGAYLPNIVGRGHAIGLHSMNHEYPWYTDTAYASPSEQMEQLIAKVSAYGVQSNLWRAPGGVWEPVLPEPYNKIFYRYQWDINPEDLVGRTSDDIYSSYVAAMNAKADDSIIILLHGWTPSVLPPIIDDLVRRGYQFGTLPRPSDSIGPIITD